MQEASKNEEQATLPPVYTKAITLFGLISFSLPQIEKMLHNLDFLVGMVPT
jgi:hypothetical protein